jgi:WD40 repeat protein/transcriptional regulator with XRE-family HTH domain
VVDTSQVAAESFRGLLLGYRGRSRLTQRELAARVGAHRRTVQDWEAGANYPTAGMLQTLIGVLLDAGGLSAGREAEEAEALWAAVRSEAPRMQTPFDAAWWAERAFQQAAPATPRPVTIAALQGADATPSVESERHLDWGEAPDVFGFVGRAQELETLREWVQGQRCRLVALLGMGGIGKTTLAVRLAEELVPGLECLYWRSLRDALPLTEWLAGAIGFLSDQRMAPPAGEGAQLSVLLDLLRARPTLLVFDNFETLLEPGQPEAGYRDGYADYGRLLQTIGDGRHQSCLMLTSREAPPELPGLVGPAVRALELGELGVADCQALLADKRLTATMEEWATLTERCGGNGLALKVVGETIRQVFAGEVGAFLEQPGGATVFGGIRRLLAEQIDRGSALEQHVLRVLALARERVTLADLLAALDSRGNRGAVLEAVEALRRRSLVERADTAGPAAFALQSVVLEYVTDGLVADASEEIERGEPLLLAEQPLVKAQAKQYVRQIQERLIGVPVLQHIVAHHGAVGAEQRLAALLSGWRGLPPGEQGYGPGNVVNLLRLLRGDLRGLDLSSLSIRQAYLAEVDAQNASFAETDLIESVLAEAFDFPASVALSGDGELLAAGTSTGQVWLWRVADRIPLWTVNGHTGVVWEIAFSADSRLLASGGADGTLRLWKAESGRQLATLVTPGHTGGIWGVGLSADGQLLASGGEDGSVQLWEASTGRLLNTLRGHTGTVWSLAVTSNGERLVSSGTDGTVRLWEAQTGRLAATLHGHTGTVYRVAVSADGQLVASGGADATVRLWSADRGEPVATLEDHTGGVRGVALSADARILAAGSEDRTVRLWETTTGHPVGTLQGHTGGVWGVALSPDGTLAASAGTDGTVRLWEAGTGQPVGTLQGNTGGVWGVSLSPDGSLAASAGADGAVRLWEPGSGRLLATARGHTGTVWGVAISAGGQLAASSGTDGTVRLWEASTGRPVAALQGRGGGVFGVALSAGGQLLATGGGDGTLRLWDTGAAQLLATMQGHTGEVFAVALSADGRLLASGGGDGTLRLWETSTGRGLASLDGHRGGIYSVALAPDGTLVASGGTDGTVRLWEPVSGKPVVSLLCHAGGVWGVALASDGTLVASGGTDGTVRLWETSTGRPLAILQGHTGTVAAVALSADGQLVASGSFDGTVRLWESSSGTALRTLRPERRYERMDITGLTGITEAQRQALVALGGVDRSVGPGGRSGAGC